MFDWYELLAADTHTDMFGLKLTFFGTYYYLFVYSTRFSSVSPSKKNFFFLNTEECKLNRHLTFYVSANQHICWNLSMSYEPHQHVYNKRHITTLHVYELTFMWEGGGDCGSISAGLYSCCQHFQVWNNWISLTRRQNVNDLLRHQDKSICWTSICPLT